MRLLRPLLYVLRPPLSLYAKRPTEQKADIGKGHSSACLRCRSMTISDAIGARSSLKKAPCSCAHEAKNGTENDQYFAELWAIKKTCILANLSVSSTEFSSSVVSTVGGPIMPAMPTLLLIRFRSEPTDTSKVLAAARNVMRPLLQLLPHVLLSACLAADRPKS